MTKQEFDDGRTVQLRVAPPESVSFVAHRRGIVTQFDCRANNQVVSGSTIVSIDGTPLLSLATSTPLWRDLAVGDEGADVSALQAELARLGHNLAVDGKVGRATIGAMGVALARIGAPSSDSGIESSSIAWAPAPVASVDLCHISVGESVDGDQKIAALRAGHAEISVVDLPGDLVAGTRVLDVAGAEIAVDQAGNAASDSPAMAETATQSAIAEASKPEAGPLSAVLRLAEPIVVSSVPPSSLVGVSGKRACVIERDKTLHVSIVGSQLGQTFVTFDAIVPRDIVLAPPKETPCN